MVIHEGNKYLTYFVQRNCKNGIREGKKLFFPP